MTGGTDSDVLALVERIREATETHDLDALIGCFTGDYQSTWPQHPTRSFRGREQVRRNWSQIFGSVPDLRVDVVARAVAGSDAWTEWEFGGHRVDGAPFLLRGVIVFRVRNGQAVRGRFFLEPVELDSGDADAAVGRLLGSREPSAQ